MYQMPKNSPHPIFDYKNHPTRSSSYLVRNGQDQHIETILSGVKRQASAIDLYRRLANTAPNQKHKTDLLQTLESKKAQLKHFTQFYGNLTGRHPEYQIDKLPFQHYKEGLQLAYNLEVEGCNDYQINYWHRNDPYIQNVLLWALQSDQENASRLLSLYEEEENYRLTDYGPEPFVVNIEEATKENSTFRTAIWTGEHLQVTLMSIEVGEDIGLERHPHVDQFLRIEDGQGLVQMGPSQDQLDFQTEAFDDFAIMIPAGTWHNVTNIGNKPLKLYSIYAPPEHPHGTVHETKAIAMAAEEDHHH
ncbi:cupin domain-containing protein [Halalkalibacter okhensis]|uniref:Cupin n=1 Tax=Halalkalibacter okhensis TaxID=333138 RepID=A0A0B0IIJ8_9BACI|nr:cupin domain-containing protein [Halalkalibacter okhensis]KHF39501.1 cupin [Halalkalibacter okhensis]